MARPSKIREEDKGLIVELLKMGVEYRDMVKWYDMYAGIKTTENLWSRAYRDLIGGRRVSTAGKPPYSRSRYFQVVPWDVNAMVRDKLPDGAMRVGPSDGFLWVLVGGADDEISTGEDIVGIPLMIAPGGYELFLMLRVLLCMEANASVPSASAHDFMVLRKQLVKSDRVINYLPPDEVSAGGWFVTVPRRRGIDEGWIREPYYDDEGKLCPYDELLGYVHPRALAENYPMDVGELIKPPM